MPGQSHRRISMSSALMRLNREPYLILISWEIGALSNVNACKSVLIHGVRSSFPMVFLPSRSYYSC